MTVKLLCVEDNATQRKMIDLMLAATGIDVDFASNGAEALEAYQASEYDAVLMDVDMPEMSGLQAAKEIRQMEGGFHLGYTPILFLTGEASEAHIDEGFSAGGDGHLLKPFTSEALMGAIDTLLHAAKGLRLPTFPVVRHAGAC
jgi:CheY-like chemotaxis protein